MLLVTTTISGGFNSAISLSASGQPVGVSMTFNPSTIAPPGSGTSVMTMTVINVAKPGTYPITVTGNGGGIKQTATVTLTITPAGKGSFTISAIPTTLTIAQGQQGISEIFVILGSGFSGSVSLSASGMPTGTTVNFSPQTIPVPGDGISTMTITVGGNTTPGTYPITVTGTGGGIQQNTTVTLTVVAGQSFTLSASPSSLTVQQGNQGTSTITATISGGFNSSIALSYSGAPSGTSVSFSPNPIPAPGSGNSTMTITVGSNTPTGTYPITVTGTGGGMQQNTTVTLTVTSGGQGNFTISASPSQVTVAQGSKGTSTITTTISNGFNSGILLSASGQPANTFVSFQPIVIGAPGAGNSTMYIAVGSSTPVGTYPITVTGNGGGIQHNTTVTLTVVAGGNFTISASPSSLTIQQGNQGGSTITTTISGGFNSSISLSYSGAPSGTTVTFNPQTIPPPGNGNSAMTITVGSNTPPGTYPITVTGNGGGVQQNTTVTLTVTSGGPPNFAISASPSSLSIQQGNQGTSTITTTISGGFNSSISLSYSGAPSGTTVTFNPQTIPSPGNGNSTVTITVGSTTPTGTYPITVTGNGGGIQQNTTVTLTVTSGGGPNFAISASPSSLSIVQGYQGISTITTTVSGGFFNSISLSASGQPTGMTVTFNPQTIPGPGYGTSAMTIAVSTSTAVGTYPITVTGTGGGIQHNTTVVLTVTAPQGNANFTISVSPLSASLPQGNQTSVTVTTNISGGFNSSISLSAADVPAGTTVSFSPQTISAPGAGTSTMTITVGSSTLTGGYPITIMGTGGGLQRSATMTLLVTTVASAGAPFPTPPQAFVDSTWNPPTGTGGTTYYAHTTTDFVNSLNSVMPGDTIVLDAGSVYTATCGVPFALQPRSNPNGQWIYIESSALASLPPPGTQVSPSYAQYMPQITTSDSCSAIFAEPGANHYRLVGLEITSTSDVGGNPSQNPPQNNWSFYLVQTTGANPPDALVDSITLDRVYAHGSDTQDVIHAVNLDGTNMALVDSYISDIHMQANDAQGVLIFFSPGPYKIVDNYISASTENIMISPADGLGTANNPYLPSDLEIRRNHLYKPPAWDSCGVHGTVPAGGLLPDGSTCPAGVNNQWVVKDNLEFKIGQRALVTGNILENNWVSGQVGYSLVITARVSDAPNLWISDILVQSNILTNVDRGVNTLEQSNQQGYTWFGYNKRVWINNNLMLLSTNQDNVGGHWGMTTDGGSFVQGYGNTYGLTDYIVQHNTMVEIDGTPVDEPVRFSLGPATSCFTVPNSPTHNLWVLDNAMTVYPNGDCGWTTLYGGLALSGVETYGGWFPGYMSDPTGDFPSRYFGNVMLIPSGGPTNWPANNDATMTPFTYVNPGSGDYQLLIPNWTDTTDGNVSGIDWSTLQQAMNP